MSDSVERYEIRSKIGQGGVGAVYRAYDTQLKREVAIKRVLAEGENGDTPSANDNLLKEATALSSVQHPHICTVYDSGIDEDGPYVVMELINGKTLDEMVEQGILTYEDFREVAIQSQEAMIAAQDLNLVHRDLKPSNVMICWLPSGRFQVKLVDFGLAKFSAKPSLQTIDHGDAVLGSIFFMAPEQFERVPLDQRTDMYALGALYYYSLTGQYPFNGESAALVMASHLQNLVTPLHELRPDLPKWLCDWVMWHIQRDMDRRPASARIALEKFITNESVAVQGGIPQPLNLAPTGTATQPAQTTQRQLITGNTQRQLITGNTQRQLITGNTQRQLLVPPTQTQLVTQQVPLNTHRVRADGAITAPHSIALTTGRVPMLTQPVTTATAASPATNSTTSTSIPPLATQKKGMNKKKIAIISMLALGIITAFIYLIGASNDSKELERFTKFANQKTMLTIDPIPMTREELKLLHSYMIGTVNETPQPINEDLRMAAYQAIYLGQPSGENFNIPLLTAKFAADMGNNILPKTRTELMRAVLNHRDRNEKVIQICLNYVKQHPSTNTAVKIAEITGNFGEEEHAVQLLKLLRTTTNDKLKQKIDTSVRRIVAKRGSSQAIEDLIIQGYKSDDNSVRDRNRYFQLLGITTSDAALDIITRALTGKDLAARENAINALGSWKDLRPFEHLITAIKSSDKKQDRFKLTKTTINMLFSQDESASEKYDEQWQALVDATPEEDLQYKIVRQRLIAAPKNAWVKAQLEKFIQTSTLPDDLLSEAKKKLDALNKD